MKNFLFFLLLTWRAVSFGQAPASGTAGLADGFQWVGEGHGALELDSMTNRKIRIRPGVYGHITIYKPQNVKIDARGVTIQNSSLDISKADRLEIFGLTIRDFYYRAVNIRGLCNRIYFHDMKFKNIGNCTIMYEYDGLYDGTDASASMDWTLEHIQFENTGTAFSSSGSFTDKGIRGMMKNFRFLRNTITDCPTIGNIIWMAVADNYEIAGNKINRINTVYSKGTPNGIHNGIFGMTGNGSFHHNIFTNHQGSTIRAWGMSYGHKVKEILIYDNIVYNSWKYSAFELQVTPDIRKYIEKYPSRVTYTNARVFNNTAGHLCQSRDWDGQMLDLYDTGGTLEYVNNLGFDLYRPTEPVTNMINTMGEVKITKMTGNKYFASAKEAVTDLVSFKSRFPGVGAR